MPAVIVVGAQWGDEGKGKVVDLVSAGADLVVRYAGGANAGHTLMVGGHKLVTHLLPSAVLHPGVRCALGSGMVISPEVLIAELAMCEERGLEVTKRLTISGAAHVTFPFQAEIDRAANGSPRAIGTTGRGIGPTYSDKAARVGVRVRELCDSGRRRECVEALVEQWSARAVAAGVSPPTVEGTLAWAEPYIEKLSGVLGDVSLMVDRALNHGEKVVFEGAQGALLDLDHGTYPFVTSSSTIAGGACTGVGVGPTRIDEVLGITKAYCTRVGNGPFATELTGPEGERLRESGGEYGATTGRPRRCGWIDLPALRYAARINGLTALAVTKLDVLSGLERVPVCVAYRVDGKENEEFPIECLDRAVPVFRELDGWGSEIAQARTWESLPRAARGYLEEIEARVGVPVAMISVGAERSATVVRRELLC